MKKINNLVLAVLFSSVAVSAGAVLPLSNTKTDGFPLLVPEVRELDKTGDVFRVPERFTVRLPESSTVELEQLAGEMARFPGVVVRAAAPGEKAVCRLVLENGQSREPEVPEHPQGYRLTIGREGIAITARTQQGLFYGVQTLCNIIRNSDSREWPGCRIHDWPSFSERVYCFRNIGNGIKDFEAFKKVLDVLVRLKYNVFRFSVGTSFPYRDDPFELGDQRLSREQLQRFVDYCRERHVELIPGIQAWSHVTVWLRPHPRFMDLLENKEFNPKRKWNTNYCPLNPDVLDLMETVITEQIEFFKPRRFNLSLDEIVSLGTFRTCPDCQQVDPVDLFRGHLRFLENLVFSAGALPVAAQDTFMDGKPYGKEFRELLDPRTTIIYWFYEPEVAEAPIKPFVKKGFPMMGHAIMSDPYNVLSMARLIKKYGGDAMSVTHWYASSDATYLRLNRNTAAIWGGTVLSAQYIWNLDATPPGRLSFDPTLEYRRLRDGAPFLPPGTAQAAPVPLAGVVNAELSQDGGFPVFTGAEPLARLQSALAGLPESFELLGSGAGHYYGIVLSGNEWDGRSAEPVSIPVGRQAEHFSFLTMTTLPDQQEQYYCFRTYGKKRFAFEPVAKAILVYADGTRQARDLRYRWSCTDWNSEFSGYGMRFAAAGADGLGRAFNLGIFDFPNPHPGKTVDRIIFSTKREAGVAPAVLAVSAFGADAAFPSNPSEALARLTPDLGAENRGNPVPKTVEFDFEDGVGIGRVEALGRFREGTEVSARIVPDPSRAGGGQVLEITVPPAEPVDMSGYRFVRINWVMEPYAVAPESQSVAVDVRMDHPEFLHHAVNYLSTAAGAHRYMRFPPLAREWQTLYLAFSANDRSSTKPLKDAHQATKRVISFYFKSVPEETRIYLDNIGQSPADWFPLPVRMADSL